MAQVSSIKRPALVKMIIVLHLPMKSSVWMRCHRVPLTTLVGLQAMCQILQGNMSRSACCATHPTMYAGLIQSFISPGCGQGNNESAKGKRPARETGSGKTSVSILLEVGAMIRIMIISFPDCRADRSNTPIIYRAFPVWNVKVSHIVDDLVKNNSETRWFVAVLIHRWPKLT